MRRFQLCEYKRGAFAGSIYVHARLRARRRGDWTVVGVFQLTEDEWIELSELAERLGIAVIYDVEEPIPS